MRSRGWLSYARSPCTHYVVIPPSTPTALIWRTPYTDHRSTVAQLVARASCPCSFFSQADVPKGARALATLCQHLSVNVSAEHDVDDCRIVQAGVGARGAVIDSRRNAHAHSSRWYYHLAHRTRCPAGLAIVAIEGHLARDDDSVGTLLLLRRAKRFRLAGCKNA